MQFWDNIQKETWKTTQFKLNIKHDLNLLNSYNDFWSKYAVLNSDGTKTFEPIVTKINHTVLDNIYYKFQSFDFWNTPSNRLASLFSLDQLHNEWDEWEYPEGVIDNSRLKTPEVLKFQEYVRLFNETKSSRYLLLIRKILNQIKLRLFQLLFKLDKYLKFLNKQLCKINNTQVNFHIHNFIKKLQLSASNRSINCDGKGLHMINAQTELLILNTLTLNDKKRTKRSDQVFRCCA